jgi:Type ISP C-terminal specificity domain/N-6 DNA Methylase
MTCLRTYNVSMPFALQVANFRSWCESRRAGGGSPEAAIRGPVEQLLQDAGDRDRQQVQSYPEYPLPEHRLRVDLSVKVNGVMTGFVELKNPATTIDPRRFTGHDDSQWQRLRNLPNLLYTNSLSWALFRGGALVGEVLPTDDERLERLLHDFLSWQPVPIRSARQLVRDVAPLCRVLRYEVLDQLTREKAAVRRGAQEEAQPFRGLAKDWRQVLFPNASNHEFADGYAQTVTFALLLARSENIDLDGRSLHDIGDRLGLDHPLIGRALQLLTDTASSLAASLDLLRRVVGAVEWAPIRAARTDAYLRLYEDFLEEYDEDQRRDSGSYYTPREVVTEIVRLVDEVLRSHLGKARGFASPDVSVIDPAMGTGTFLNAIVNRVAEQAAQREGAGSIRQVLAEIPSRLVGFDVQMGPYAVSTLRWADLVHRFGARPRHGGFNLYLTNTLDDPHRKPDDIASQFRPLSLSQKKANGIKATQPVEVVIGNPPYHRERADGSGGWVEHGGSGHPAPLAAFRLPGNGRTEYVLRNNYVYFWRWATWKLFDAHPEHRHGVVAFLSIAGFLGGPGFRGMREYLRRTCDEGWIIDLSPEGNRPDVSTRIFPGVQRSLAICIFVRRRAGDRRRAGPDTPARIWYAAVHGRRAEKYARLAELSTADLRPWRAARDGWSDPFTPARSGWDGLPALGDLLPWATPGVKPNRTWVYAPLPEILHARWAELAAASVPERRALLKETDDRMIGSKVEPLPGVKPHTGTLAVPDASPPPPPERVAYRSFDRQWMIPDSRVLDRPRPPLWRAWSGSPGNVFVNEQHARPLRDGPGIVLAALVPDMDHFKGSEGGRVLPMRHASGAPNAAPGLLDLLGKLTGGQVPAEDLVAYLAGVLAHGGFTARYADDLVTPGIRVPLTTDPALWTEAVLMGREVAWLHTYGEAFASPGAGRPPGDIRYPEDDQRRPQCLAPVEASGLPPAVRYDPAAATLHVGSGVFGPVPAAVWEYTVGGMPVVRKWLSYRKAHRAGRTSSRLDAIHADRWPLTWTSELNELLTVVRRLVDLEPAQDELLERVVTGRLLTATDLTTAGVFPVPELARRPHRGTVHTDAAALFG